MNASNCNLFYQFNHRPSWALAGVVFIISVGLALLVMGETAFDITGCVVLQLRPRLLLSSLFWSASLHLVLRTRSLSEPTGAPLPLMHRFTLVMSASCLSGFRFTLTQVFLQGHHELGVCVCL